MSIKCEKILYQIYEFRYLVSNLKNEEKKKKCRWRWKKKSGNSLNCLVIEYQNQLFSIIYCIHETWISCFVFEIMEDLLTHLLLVYEITFEMYLRCFDQTFVKESRWTHPHRDTSEIIYRICARCTTFYIITFI